MKDRKDRIGKLLGVLVALALLAGLVLFFLRDATPPAVTLSPASGSVAKAPLSLTLADDAAGLQSLRVVAVQQGREALLLERTYAGDTGVTEQIDLAPAAMREGPFELKIVAIDNSAMGGNRTEATYPLSYDTTPPRVSVLTRAHNIVRGGSALVIYTLSEDVVETGVRVGEYTFPAYRQDSGEYLCLFPFPYNLPDGAFVPKVLAVDAAGNRSEYGFHHYAAAKHFRSDKIGISDSFLAAKMPQFSHLYPEAGSDIEVFLKVNRELRVENRAGLGKYALETSPTRLWDGAFLRQAGSNHAGFGDHRSYIYQGKEVDDQTHLGVDIASTAHAAIYAANAGTVVFAGFYGIYGECVIVDHGLGLQTLYGHLSRIEVQKGDSVSKGAVLGYSGATGMAGGDHLHFGVILAGIPVNPLEWWDPSWLQNNILSKLQGE